MKPVLFVCIFFWLGLPSLIAQSCPIDRMSPSEADLLLVKGKNKEAEKSFRTALLKSPADERARLGIVRSMVAQNLVAESENEATSFVKDQPKSGIAQLAAFEAAYRAGDIDGAFAHVKQALVLSPCEGEAMMGLAQLYEMTGLYGQAAHYIHRAHMLEPNNQFITREWMGTLPRTERLKELTAFLQSSPQVSEEALQSLKRQKQRLEVSKPGECRVVSTIQSTQTPMTAVFGRNTRPTAYGLDVTFDGKRRHMQIDTGASGIVLTEGAAAGLGLKQELAGKSFGIGDEGARESYLSHVHSIRIGEVELQDCMVSVVKNSQLSVDGLIGMNVFRQSLVTLNYPAAKLRLEPLPKDPRAPADADGAADDEEWRDIYAPPEMKSWLHVARLGQNLLLPAAVKPHAKLHYMLLDTGAWSSMVSLPMAQEAGKLHVSHQQVYGMSGKVDTLYETDETALYVGSLHLAPQAYFAMDMTKMGSFEIGGFLGLPTLQRLTIQIDYRDNLVNLIYDPKHDVVRF